MIGGTRSKTSKIQTIHNSVSSRDYVLNPDKWLQKKLQATKRQEIEYVIKGGGIVAKLDAVSFGLFTMHVKASLITQMMKSQELIETAPKMAGVT